MKQLKVRPESTHMFRFYYSSLLLFLFQEFYIQRVVDMVKNLSRKSIVWQEVFQNGVRLANDTVVHVWLGNRYKKNTNQCNNKGFNFN